MISYSLHCAEGHDFEAWFRNADDYDAQAQRGLVTCPTCGSAKVNKALMAPAVSTAKRRETLALAAGAEQAKMIAQLQELARKVRSSAENVGDKFAEEARKIHFGETQARGIYGEATLEEAKSLAEDGVGFLPLPSLPEEKN
ncbi:DUF1178 family protein [Tianweitania sp. BSSL-BM11]|uniref:DUF1178 family protein n=1 Tax=Tianweitania aestuarii TaxID=2814886 RepID=A0ABS5RZG4_9HYPH|nr:DUF1178 family protein [Tianweitania aestuarii]MBS9722411.1 DUF1178 family protein [Tianweitania aestuarii]